MAVYDGSDCFTVKKYFEMEPTVLPLPTSLLKRVIIWCDHYRPQTKFGAR